MAYLGTLYKKFIFKNKIFFTKKTKLKINKNG